MTNPQNSRQPRSRVFPIAEAFGFPYDSPSPVAAAAWRDERCPFAGNKCEKKVQYGYGYCSVVYSAEWDGGTPQPYAVCDHRLDGQPIRWAIADHFGNSSATLVPEVTAPVRPKLNLDYIAFKNDPNAEGGVDMIAIESQAIDLRGGGVGPAWRAWEDGRPEQWRAYFTEESIRRGRKDTVAYGVNTGNVYKRLGTQVAIKGEYLREVSVPLYVVTQHRIMRQLRSRVNFTTVQDSDPWEIAFVGFDYLGTVEENGMLSFGFVEVVRTTLAHYREALTSSRAGISYLRADLIKKVKGKAVSTVIGESEIPLSGPW